MAGEWMSVEQLPIAVPEYLLLQKKPVGRPQNSDPLCEFSLADVADRLKWIPSDDRDLWRSIVTILGRLFDRSDEAWALANEWSDSNWNGTKGKDHDKTMRECFYEISQQDTDTPLTIGTIIYHAKLHGWVPPPDPRPQLNASTGDLHKITEQAWKAIPTGSDEPKLFLYGRLPSRIEPDETGALRIVELTPDRLRYHAAKLGRWITPTKSGHRACRPPMDVMKNMLAMADIPLPVLERIVSVPVFTSTGKLVQTPGYDAEARIYYHPYEPGLTLSIPSTPTSNEVRKAKAALDAVLEDFPFVSDADRSHAVGLTFVPFVRDMIPGPVPLTMNDASTPGTGKTLLAEVALCPALGVIEATSEARDDEEWRKRLTSCLREGQAAMLIDNVSRLLDSASLSSALTTRAWKDRLLGTNDTVSIPVRMIFVATANNPTLSLEMVRRTVRCRLDAKVAKPWERDGWKIPNLRQYVHENRPRLIVAILTLVQAWLTAGRPRPTAKPPGSYEDWCAVVGGIVTFAGYRDFLGNAAAMYEEVNTDAAVWFQFVTQWRDKFGDHIVTVRDHLFDLAKSIDDFPMGRATTEHGQRAALGHALLKHRDQVFADCTITKVSNTGGTALWRLTTAEDRARGGLGTSAF